MPTFQVTGPDGGTYQIDAPDQQSALEAFQHVNEQAHAQGAPQQAQPQAPGMIEDVAKAVPSGLAKGGAGLAGMAGDIRDVGANLFRGLLKAKGLAADEVDQYVQRLGSILQSTPGAAGGFARLIANVPTAAQVRKAIEKITGPLYEPQTRAGRFAQTAAEFVPAAVLAPEGSLATNALRYGVVPGLTSEAAGQATEGTPLEPYARAAGAVTGGVGSAALLRPGTASRALRSQLPDYVTAADVSKAERLIADAKARGVTLTWPEALSQVTGRPVLTDMQRLVESAPQTRAKMQEVFADRPRQVWEAAKSEVENLGPAPPRPASAYRGLSDITESIIGDTRDAINRATKPLYAAAANTKIPPAEFAKIQALPGWAPAAKAVRADPQLNRYVAGLPDDSVGFLDAVKKQLDQEASNAASKINPAANQARAAGLTADAAAVRGAAAAASPDYAAALDVQARARQDFLEPLLAGPIGRLAKKDLNTQQAIEALFPARPLPGSEGEVGAAVRMLGKKSPTVARQLVRAHLESKLNEAFTGAGRTAEAAQFGGATFAARAAGNPAVDTQRFENLKAAVEALPDGPATWAGFERLLEIARATGTRQAIGSKTAFNAAELERLATGSSAGNAVKLGLSPGKWVNFVHDRWSDWQLGRNLDQIATILTDPASGRLLRRLAQMPSGSRQAGTAAARIIVQTATDATARKRVPDTASEVNQ